MNYIKVITENVTGFQTCSNAIRAQLQTLGLTVQFKNNSTPNKLGHTSCHQDGFDKYLRCENRRIPLSKYDTGVKQFGVS